MRTIYKYQLPLADDVGISMPAGAQVLTVQMQDDKPCIWALVDANAKVEIRAFKWRGTGHPADDLPLSGYVGTVQMHGGALVFHLSKLEP